MIWAVSRATLETFLLYRRKGKRERERERERNFPADKKSKSLYGRDESERTADARIKAHLKAAATTTRECVVVLVCRGPVFAINKSINSNIIRRREELAGGGSATKVAPRCKAQTRRRDPNTGGPRPSWARSRPEQSPKAKRPTELETLKNLPPLGLVKQKPGEVSGEVRKVLR